MLQKSLEPFLSLCTSAERAQALRAVSHLIMVDDYMAYRNLIKGLSPRVHEVFYKEVRDFVRSSFDCRKIWRTLLAALQGKDREIRDTAKYFGADIKDVAMVWGSLTPSDKKQVRVLADKHVDGYGYLSDDEFSKLVQVLEKYCSKVAYLKLKFLSNNDRIYELNDLKVELLAHAIQVVRLYEHCGDLKKIENFAKRGVSNHAVNIIQFHTSESRARVTNNTRGCDTCVFCLTDKPQKCKHAVADYRSTTLSLQGMSAHTDSLPQPSFRSAPTADRRLHKEGFMSFMKEDMTDSARRIIDLVINSDPDEEFEKWLEGVHNLTVDTLLTNPKRLVRLLCEYLDVSHTEVTNSIKDRYTEYRQSTQG